MSINKRWGWVPEYEGLYLVSDEGDVISLPKRGRVGIELLQQTTSSGYKQVSLFKDGKYKRVSVHRIVASVFCENPMVKEQVNHKDGDKQNNDAANLEWCTSSENNKHKYEVLGVKHSVKSRRLFSNDQVRAIRKSSKSSRAVAREFGVAPGTINQIRKRKSYREVI